MASAAKLTIEQLLSDLKNKIYSPVYLLHGEESFYIDVISDYIEQNLLSDLEKEFNQTVVYGRDTDVPTLISNARRFPMMANYQVLIVKEAHELDKIDELHKYTEQPLSTTILVICLKYVKIDKRKSFYKSVEKNGVVFESAKLYDNQVPDWITNYLKARKYRITPKAAMIITEFLGNDLGKIVNELQKLLINIPPGSEITEDTVEQNIGISKDFNIFELQKSLGKKEVFKANQIIQHFSANPKENPLVMVVASLSRYFTQLLTYHTLSDKSQNNVAAELGIKPFFVSEIQQAARNYPPGKIFQIISFLREYDLKSKGIDSGSASDGELMKELIFKILH